MTDNLKKIMSAVRESEADAVLVTSPENRFYATGFSSTAGDVVISADGAALFIDSRYFEEASERLRDVSVIKAEGIKYFDQLSEYLKKSGIRKLGFEERSVSYAEYKRFKEKLPAEFLPEQGIFDKLRAVKSREELRIMIRAQRTAERAFNALLPQISRSVTEKELASELTGLMLRYGADDRSFDTILVSGAHSSVPHGKPRDVKLETGFLTIDFGCIVDGYCSDTTRTLCVGEPTKEMEKVYNTVLNAQMAAIDAARGGITGKELDAAARNVIADADYGEYFTHSLSHGLGIEIHEMPNASPSADAVLPAGAVISNEPGIYIPGSFGVRIEDVLYLTESGCEDITELSKELTVICA